MAPPADKLLFIVCMNHSGSTWMQNIFLNCKRAVGFVNARRPHNVEGQSLIGNKKYPSDLSLKCANIWSEKAGKYQNLDWTTIEKRWRKEWKASPKFKKAKPLPRILVEKSPPNALLAQEIWKHFGELAHFVIMVRNPYAVVESILRSRRTQKVVTATRAAEHWVRCTEKQIENIDVLPGERSRWFTYESLCETSSVARGSIMEMLPELDDLDFGKKSRAHSLDGSKAQVLKNYNDRQIARLKQNQIDEITEVLKCYHRVVEYFGYELLGTVIKKVQKPTKPTKPDKNTVPKGHKPMNPRLGNRKFLVNMLPKQGVGAEIGVWTGVFSSHMIRGSRPSEFHAIDPWEFQPKYTNRAYGKAIENQGRMDNVFAEAQWRINEAAEEVGTNAVFHRKGSHEVVAEFPDGFFDWVYIDGNHSYEFVKKDMMLYLPKVKIGGLLTGDDVRWAGDGGQPVQKAVSELKNKEPRVKFITVKNDQFIFERVE